MNQRPLNKTALTLYIVLMVCVAFGFNSKLEEATQNTWRMVAMIVTVVMAIYGIFKILTTAFAPRPMLPWEPGFRRDD